MTLRKADLRKALAPLCTTVWRGEVDIQSQVSLKGDKTLGKFKKLLKDGGDKNFIAVCEELGALGEAVGSGAKDLAGFLLETGINPSAVPKNGRKTALGVLTAGHRKLTGDDLLELCGRFLEAGATPEADEMGSTPFDGPIAEMRWDLVELLASAATSETKAVAVNKAINEAADAQPSDGRYQALEGALQRLGADHSEPDGMTALHTAAATGRVCLYDLVEGRCANKNPALGSAVTRTGWRFPSAPGGGVVPKLQFAAGSTPVDMIGPVRMIFMGVRQACEAVAKPSPYSKATLERTVSRLKEMDELEARLRAGGASSGAAQPELAFEGPIGEIADALLRLADAVGTQKQVRAAMSSIDLTGKGPLNFFLAAVPQCGPVLVDAIKRDDHPLAAMLRGTHKKRTVLYRKVGKSNDTMFIAKPADYPAKAKRVFKTLILGMDGDTILGVTREQDGAELWAITTGELRSLGGVVQFVNDGVDVLLGREPNGAAAQPAESKATESRPAEAKPVAPESWVRGKYVCITGKMKLKRAVAEQGLETLGANITKSITKKTEVLFAGRDGGAKLERAKEKDITILDEAALVSTLRGEAPTGPGSVPAARAKPAASAKAPASSRTPMPVVDSPPEDGEHEERYPSGQLKSKGRYQGGEKVGAWTSFHANGAKRADEVFEDGVLHGPQRYFHDNGECSDQGRSEHGKSEGRWDSWHANGQPRVSYNYVAGLMDGEIEFLDPDGQSKATGQYREGKLVGQWCWMRQSKHEKVVRGYDQDSRKHGVEAAWWPGGELAYHREYEHGTRVGRQEEYASDGSTTKKELYDHRARLIERWDFSGKKPKLEAFVDGVPKKLADNEKKLQKLAAKIDDAEDVHRAREILERVVDYDHIGALVQLLWKKGLFDLPGSREFHTFVTDDPLVSSEMVMDFLRTAKAGEDDLLFEGWPSDFDELVAFAYGVDPAPIDAGWKKLPKKARRGVAFVLARFGNDVGAELKGIAPDLASAMMDHFPSQIAWPQRKGDAWEVEPLDLYQDHVTTPMFDEFVSLYGGDDWPKTLLAAGLKAAKESEYPVILERFEAAFRIAPLSDLEAIFQNAEASNELVRVALLQWRADSGAELDTLCRALPDGPLASRVAAAAAVASQRDGTPLSPEATSRIRFSFGHVNERWMEHALTQTESGKRGEPLALDGALNFADQPGLGTEPFFSADALIVDAFRSLPIDIRRSKLSELIDGPDKLHAQPLLHLVDDPKLWRTALKTSVVGDNTPAALGLLPLRAIPLLVEARDEAKGWARKKAYTLAILGVLARAASAGEALEPTAQEHIYEAFGIKELGRYKALLTKVLFRQPKDQCEGVLLRALAADEPRRFLWAVANIACCPSEPVLHAAFEGLLAISADGSGKIGEYEARQWCVEAGAGLRAFSDRGPWIEWCMRNGVDASIHQAFECANRNEFLALKRKLAAEGTSGPTASPTRSADKIDALQKLASKATAAEKTTEPIYAFRRLETKTTTLNQIGGLPMGVSAEAWPRLDDEGMVHLFTLDLATMPELQANAGGMRTMSLFVAHPNSNHASTAHTDEVAVIFLDDASVQTASQAPEGTQVRPAQSFETVRVEVPETVWEDDSSLRSALCGLEARALGEPVWLQDDEDVGGFVMQFDESFADINLGDTGVMYVFQSTAFWQCH
ncbi:MAG: BRCT domain-containing protein [Myxococcota bacterium]